MQPNLGNSQDSLVGFEQHVIMRAWTDAHIASQIADDYTATISALAEEFGIDVKLIEGANIVIPDSPVGSADLTGSNPFGGAAYAEGTVGLGPTSSTWACNCGTHTTATAECGCATTNTGGCACFTIYGTPCLTCG